MLTKAQLIQSIKDLPDQFSLEDVMDRIMLIQKIEIGIEQSDAQQTLTTKEAKEKLGKWLK
ncbi:hypothetical protein [Pedobacter cryophilus]|uniref:Uncharacterized protein n=1 Tax=Pedobacter cryophilus TaxID=2571271 RepID=A0A4U1BYT0_9SPHI|nr:hypothetical protein [Pedobacter cryophilus]TKB96833.1 hypothetical protein FA046_12175 [Pedobacter cryophilus]